VLEGRGVRVLVGVLEGQSGQGVELTTGVLVFAGVADALPLLVPAASANAPANKSTKANRPTV
jgi:hypothetical protein